MNTEEPVRNAGPPHAELEFVERVALGLENQGLMRMAGRIIGWLLICDPPEQSFVQLTEVLQASKGSVSTALAFLVPSGWVQRLARPGERRDYFRINNGVWFDAARAQSRRYGTFRELLADGLALLDDQPTPRRERLQDMYDFYQWLEQEMPALWARWLERPS